MVFEDSPRCCKLEDTSCSPATPWPDDVKEIVKTMNYSKRCRGINDEKFNLLLIKHNGKFFDHSGKLYVMYTD